MKRLLANYGNLYQEFIANVPLPIQTSGSLTGTRFLAKNINLWANTLAFPVILKDLTTPYGNGFLAWCVKLYLSQNR